jgi:hypothetical protein
LTSGEKPLIPEELVQLVVEYLELTIDIDIDIDIDMIRFDT